MQNKSPYRGYYINRYMQNKSTYRGILYKQVYAKQIYTEVHYIIRYMQNKSTNLHAKQIYIQRYII